jgi:hypothetical protein
MHFLGPVQLILLAGRGDHVEVSGNVLAGGRAGQQRQQGAGILQAWHHLLDAGDGDMARRHGSGHAPVALIFHQAEGAGFRHRKVYPGDAHIRCHELFP